MSSLIVFDGNNLSHRAFWGLRSQMLSTSSGEGTWEVFGAFNSLVYYIKRYEPTHVLVAFDYGRSTKRSNILPTYKTGRVHDDQDIDYVENFRQLGVLQSLLEAMNFPIYRELGVEADDIIAKVVLDFKDQMDQIVVVSADHDIRQLVDKNVLVVKPSLGYNRVQEGVYTYQGIVDYYGLEPQRLPEIWALTGDSGDSVVGIKGIGEKTAIKLIKQYGSLVQVLLSNEKKVQGQEEVARLALSLVELDGSAVKGSIKLDDLQFNPTQVDSPVRGPVVDYLFDALEFVSFKTKWVTGTLFKPDEQLGRRLES